MNNQFLLNSMIDPIDEHSILHIFNLSTWGSILAFIFVLISILIISFVIYKKSRSFSLIIALILGVIGLSIFGILFSIYPVDLEDGNIYWATEALDWLKLIGILFISLISIIIPLYIFGAISIFVLKTNMKSGGIIKSLISLVIIPFIGILISLLMIPLILLIPHDLWTGTIISGGNADDVLISIPEIIISGAASSLSIFLNIDSILAVIIFAILFSISIKLASKEKKELLKNSINVFENLNAIIIKYIGLVVYLIPFAIATMLSTIAMQKDSTTNIKLVGIYFGIFSLGSIIIFILLFIANLFMSGKTTNLPIKDRVKLLLSHSLFGLINQSVILTLPKTQDTLINFKIKEDLANFIPTTGTVMGMIMCNGFSPMMMVLFSIMYYNQGNLSFVTLIFAILMVILLGISSSGAGSADYTIILSTLGTLGINTAFYLVVLMPVQEVNEKLYPTINNSSGHILATQIANVDWKKTKK